MPKFRTLQLVLILAFLILGWSTFIEAKEGGTIHAVIIQGNQRISKETILYYIKTKAGQPLSRNIIRRDIQEIHALGHFSNIQVETRETLEGLDVIFKVEEIPSVGLLEISGSDQIDSNEILEKIPIKRGSTYREHLIQESRQEIRTLYNDKGYFFVNVDIKAKPNAENQVDVMVRVKEGEKVAIEKIRISGNRNLNDKEILKVIETQAKTWLSFLDDSGIYKKDVLKLDLLRIEAYYQDHGFLKVRVMEPRIDVNRKSRKIYITIPIEEGYQYKIGKILVKEDDTFSGQELRKAIAIQEGDVYNLSQVRADVLNLTELYSEKGYAYADIIPLTAINDSARTVDLEIKTERGRKVYVGQINIQGNTKTLDNVIRREFRLKEGELFNSKKLKRSKQRINNLGFFEDVKIDTRPGKSPDLLDIETTITERPTGSFSVGAGFSSIENLIFTANVSQDNIFGRGQKLAFGVELSSRRNNFNLSVTDPRIFDSTISGGIDAFNRTSNFFSFESRNRGGGFRLGKSIGEYDWAGLSYRYESVRIKGVQARNETPFLFNGDRTTSRISPSYIRDTRDDFLNPTSGWRHKIRLDMGGLGGIKFYRSGYEVSYYRPLIGKLVGAIHGEINWADGYGGDILPTFERYFMGGPNSLRGFTIRDIGPKNETGDPVGGKKSLLINSELQYPFTKAFRGFVFYDRGNVFGSGSNLATTTEKFDIGEMRSSIGLGIRFVSPFGPIGFAYGYKLDRNELDQNEAGEFHFSAGGGF